MLRSNINSEIRKDVIKHWTTERKEKIERQLRKTILHSIDEFEKQEEPKIQSWAHKMAPGDHNISAHADRNDLKISMRKYLRQQIIIQLGYQQIFEINDEKTKTN